MATVQSRSINFHFPKTVTLTGRNKIKGTITRILKDAGLKPQAINYIFCSDEDLWRLNLQFLKHDNYTDIVTFDLSESKQRVTADIYISVDRVKENAVSHGVTLRHELLRVIFHGALHLGGLKDKSAKDQKFMRRKEDQYLAFHERSTKHGFPKKHTP